MVIFVFFFFQAEDGIRDLTVTGVQTCALPIFDNWKSKTLRLGLTHYCLTPRYKILEFQLSKVGFPIRKSMDQSFFAAPHGLSQRSTSFIASQRQGIHRTPLRHLIALIINVHTLGRM